MQNLNFANQKQEVKTLQRKNLLNGGFLNYVWFVKRFIDFENKIAEELVYFGEIFQWQST